MLEDYNYIIVDLGLGPHTLAAYTQTGQGNHGRKERRDGAVASLAKVGHLVHGSRVLDQDIAG